MKHNRSLCWIRRDLRLADHRALYEACSFSKSVAVVFVYDTTILKKLKGKNDRRMTFINKSLQLVDQKLREKGSALVTLYGDPREEIPLLAKRLSVEAVFCNQDYEPSAKKRDKIIARRLQSKGIAFLTYKDQVVFEGLDIVTQTGSPFRVFTPYKKAWLKKLSDEDVRIFRPNLKNLTPIRYLKEILVRRTLNDIGFQNAKIWLEAGEDAAQKRLTRFLKNIDNYEEIRDLPAEGGTSGLSVHLRFGTISIRRLVREACKFKSKGSQAWLSELIWRDFYQMILDRFPYIVKHTFLPQYDQIKWPGSNAHFNAWKEGRTGYPLVDAAMRHFNATGWMHNRLRMVVASFLTKDLLVYWRRGEQ
jgi:deoxyribodipyrimidine photo-lyase